MVPLPEQNILGITLNTCQDVCSLKDGKHLKIVSLVSSILDSKLWKLKELQKLCGNTIWVSILLPRLRAYLTPVIELLKVIPDSKGFVAKKSLVELDTEVIRALNFLKPVFAVDPCVHVKRFLNLLPQCRCVIWSDASGFEMEVKNPTPGRMGSIFLAPFLPNSEYIVAYSD